MPTQSPLLRLNNDTEMPALGLGVFQSSPEQTIAAVETALAERFRLIDNAAVYMNEREVGQAIRNSKIDRSEIFVTTKLWISDFGFEQALRACDVSLRKLGLDYVDLYLIHWPVPKNFEATIAAYKAAEQLLADGKTRAIGVSNFSPQHLETLIDETDIVPAVNQIELHPFFTQPEIRQADDRLGIITQSWSPIGGVQVYNPKDPSAVKNPLEHPTITALAARHGKTPAQIILRWHIEHGLSAIPKSVRPERIAENINLFDFSLTTEEITAIDALQTNQRGGPDPEDVSPEVIKVTIPDA